MSKGLPDRMVDEDAARYRGTRSARSSTNAGGDVRGGLGVCRSDHRAGPFERCEDDLDGEELSKGQVRHAAAGRKAVAARNSGLVPALSASSNRPRSAIPCSSDCGCRRAWTNWRRS